MPEGIPENEPNRPMSRRALFAKAASMGAAAISEKLTNPLEGRAKALELKEASDREEHLKEVIAHEDRNFDEKFTEYADTLFETILYTAGNELFASVARKLGVKTGINEVTVENEELLEKIREQGAVASLIDATFVAPIVEEIGFRLLASRFAAAFIPHQRGDLLLPSGTAAAALFAALHIVGYDSGEKKLVFKEGIPLQEFGAGIFFWYLMRHRGISHAVLAHSFNNFAGFSYAQLLLAAQEGES